MEQECSDLSNALFKATKEACPNYLFPYDYINAYENHTSFPLQTDRQSVFLILFLLSYILFCSPLQQFGQNLPRECF